MKKFIAFAFLVMFMTLGATALLHDANVSNTNQTEIYKPATVYLNDAITPDVSPVYGKAYFVHASDESVKGFDKQITPNANAPPVQGITGV